MNDIVLAVDGGNVKTDLALVDADGALLSLVRGGRSNTHYVGVDGCIAVLEALLARARANAGLDSGRSFKAATAEVMVAGADLPEEMAELRAAVDRLAWSGQLVVDNDTLALLRSGTDRGWGVAVVCGGGINCVGIAPDGQEVRFPSLGAISGDWGGGYDVGLAALMAAARGADGRGPRTALESEVPAYFDLAEPLDVARAIHLGELPAERLGELGRVVFPAAQADPVAAEIVSRLASEVITFAVTAMRRLKLLSEQTDVVLGGGLIRAAPQDTIDQITAGVHAVAPNANVVVAVSPPIVGAVLLGLDRLAAAAGAATRARAELTQAFRRVEGDGSRLRDTDFGVSLPGRAYG
jgi:N-acetylglucosamine kinase-like BadF-type ATPase